MKNMVRVTTILVLIFIFLGGMAFFYSPYKKNTTAEAFQM